MEESPIHAAALQQAHGPGIAIGKNGLWIIFADFLQSCGGSVQRFVPGNPFESAFALPAGPLHRIKKAIIVVGPLFIMSYLYAKTSVCICVLRVTLDAHSSAAIVNFDKHRAGIGTIVRTNGSDGFHMQSTHMAIVTIFPLSNSSTL